LPTIPEKVRRTVEWHLKNGGQEAERLRKELEDLTDELTALRSPDLSGTPHGSGISDPVARAAERLASKREQLEKAEAWAVVLQRTREHFRGLPEGVVLELVYVRGHTQQAAADGLDIDRQTVRRHRESVVCFAALVAAERGLIRIE